MRCLFGAFLLNLAFILRLVLREILCSFAALEVAFQEPQIRVE